MVNRKLLILIVMILCSFSCNKRTEKTQRTVTYQEKVDSVDTSKICKNKEDKSNNNSYNVIPKDRRISNTLKSKDVSKVKTIPKDVVDLNDYLSEPGDGTDWNYTEIDDEQKSHLDSLGIYWDNKTGYWRKRK